MVVLIILDSSLALYMSITHSFSGPPQFLEQYMIFSGHKLGVTQAYLCLFKIRYGEPANHSHKSITGVDHLRNTPKCTCSGTLRNMRAHTSIKIGLCQVSRIDGFQYSLFVIIGYSFMGCNKIKK